MLSDLPMMLAMGKTLNRSIPNPAQLNRCRQAVG